jgi:hypothetical protein
MDADVSGTFNRGKQFKTQLSRILSNDCLTL